MGLFGWVRSARARPGGPGARPEPVEQSCPGIARVLQTIFKNGKQPEVLDLGQLSGPPALYLADRGARVAVERFEPPPAPEAPASSGEPPARAPLKISHPDARFDLVLAWEHADFLPPDRVEEFMAEVRRVMAPGGYVVLFSQDRQSREGAEPDRPASYRLEADDKILWIPGRAPERPRWAYANRAIEKALAPLAVQGIHLHGNRLREVVARKPR